MAASDDDRILVYDVSDRRLVRQVNLSANDKPSRLLVNEIDNELYVLNTGSNSLSTVDLQSYQEVDRQSVGDQPQAMALDESTGKLYVTSNNAREIGIYDRAARTMGVSYSISGAPGELVFNSLDGLMIVALESQRVLQVLDANTGNQRAILTICSQATGLALNPTTQQVFAALGDCREIGVFRPEDEVNLGRIRLSDEPGLMSLDPEYRRLLVTLPATDRVAFVNINSKRVEGEIEVGDGPYQVVILD